MSSHDAQCNKLAQLVNAHKVFKWCHSWAPCDHIWTLCNYGKVTCCNTLTVKYHLCMPVGFYATLALGREGVPLLKSLLYMYLGTKLLMSVWLLCCCSCWCHCCCSCWCCVAAAVYVIVTVVAVAAIEVVLLLLQLLMSLLQLFLLMSCCCSCCNC